MDASYVAWPYRGQEVIIVTYIGYPKYGYPKGILKQLLVPPYFRILFSHLGPRALAGWHDVF